MIVITMDEDALSRIDKYLKKHLDRKRYIHTLGVAYTATALAMCHGADLESAKVAGLLHDSAKCMDGEKRAKKCQKYHIEITTVEKENPFLLHGKIGACLARYKFGIDDDDICNAIANHTTGRPKMSVLEKIIYIADYIEPNRSPLPHLDEIRKLAFHDLDKTMVVILENTLSYLKEKNAVIDPMSKDTYDYYKSKVKM